MTGPDDSLPPEIEVIAAPVRARVAAVLAAARDEWQAVDPDLADPIDAIAAFVDAGGKRLRPAFCYWGFVAAGGDPADPTVVDAGAAFELLHAFALVHDDVMDGSLLRRGRPTVHEDFARRHQTGGWTGEARRFGEGVAILAGDLAFVFANQLIAGVNPVAIDVWNRLAIEVNVGQYLDVLGAARGNVDLVSARRISRYKSGKYTIERPLHLGAALAGRLAELTDAFSAYGAPLGEAFQLRDDLLGAFGDARLTGKPVGDDLREGKPTPLLAVARQRCTGDDARLLARVGDPDLSDADIGALRELLERCGARAAVEQAIIELTDEAVRALDDAPIDGAASAALGVLARYVGARER